MKFEIDTEKITLALKGCSTPSIIYVSNGLNGVMASLQSPNDIAVVRAAKKIIDAIEETTKSEGVVTYEKNGVTFERSWAAVGEDGEVTEVHSNRKAAIGCLSHPGCTGIVLGWRKQGSSEFYRSKDEADASAQITSR